MSFFPSMFQVGRDGRVDKADPAEYDGDPRGFLWLWEPPMKQHTYVIGCDPTVGRTNWNRYARVREDSKTDNGVLEIVRIGKGRVSQCTCQACKAIAKETPDMAMPDHQVGEYAAPVDAAELGGIINVVGRMFAGTEEDQAKVIIEVFPGPGALTLQTTLSLGYVAHFHWEYYGNTPATPTKALGWTASPRTNRDLWVKASRHITIKSAIIRSPWLVEEYSDARMDPDKQYAENPGGHDDRVRAFNLALWVANSWSVNIERTQEKVSTVEAVDWQASDLSLDEIHDGWNNLFDRIS